MSDETLEERLAAVERALTDAEDTDLVDPHREFADRLDALEADVAELEAAVQALRGYVGSVKSVNDGVEERADAALAKAEAVERALTDPDAVSSVGRGCDVPPENRERGLDTDHGSPGDASRGVGGTVDGVDPNLQRPAPDPGAARTEPAREDEGSLLDRLREAL